VTVVRSANYLRAIVPLFLSALDLVRDPLKGRAFLGRDAPKPEEAARGVGDGLAELEEVVRRDVEAASRHEQRADQTPRAPEDAFLGSPIQPFRELPICRASLLDPSRATSTTIFRSAGVTPPSAHAISRTGISGSNFTVSSVNPSSP
jgi:hypothetical protein